MIKVINGKSKKYKRELVSFLDKRRSGKFVDTSIVPKIIKDIRKNGKKALIKYEKKFSKNSEIVTSANKINKAIKTLDPKIKKAIDLAYNRIFKFHSLQKVKDIKYVDNFKNKLEYKHVPIQSVGIYVPANLPSTLLMNAVPAKISGIKRIVLANPKLDGKLNPGVLYAAKKVGIKEIYSMGGAQAIASLAYIQKVNKIIGPGNIYVSRSKREVFGDVGTEGMVAGPSEICVLADGKTDLNQVVTSMIGQAEHDVNSQCILITKDKKLVNKFNMEIKDRIKNVERKNIVLKSLKNNGLIVLAYNDKQIVDTINEVAPEHLEIDISGYKKYLNQIHNVGSIMIGKYSPMAISDYNVGTNHVLPTLGSAKFSSGLNLSEFYKKISHITLTKKGIEKLGESAKHLAEYEELDNHAQSIKSRMRRK
tara:strand:- start:267 stop:1532 length:1266 start_codon:yes stop_codon:yes gene_type:complete